MAFITRWTIRWNGGGIAGAATSTLHYALTGDVLSPAVVTPVALNLQTAINDGLRKVIPGGVTLAVSPEVQSIDLASGQILDIVTPTNGTAPMPGQGTGNYSVASGAVISLNSAGIFKGRRVRGRVFCVPLSGDAYDVDGTLAGGAVNFLQATGNEFMTAAGNAGSMIIYSRPSSAAAGDGHLSAVTSVSVRDKVAVLRSRRD